MSDRPIIQTVRMEALAVAASFFDEYPDLGRLWSLATFCEQFVLHGGDGTKEDYAPGAVAELRVVPK